LSAVTREHEVGIASNRIEEWYGEYFSGLVHPARHARGDGCILGTMKDLINKNYMLLLNLCRLKIGLDNPKKLYKKIWWLLSWYDLLTQVKS